MACTMGENLDAATVEQLQWQAYRAEVPEESNSGLELRRILGSLPLDPLGGYLLSDTMMPKHRIAKRAVLRQEPWNMIPVGPLQTTRTSFNWDRTAEFSVPSEPSLHGLAAPVKAKASVADSEISELFLDSDSSTIDSEWPDIGSVLDGVPIDSGEVGERGPSVAQENQKRVHFEEPERSTSEFALAGNVPT